MLGSMTLSQGPLECMYKFMSRSIQLYASLCYNLAIMRLSSAPSILPSPMECLSQTNACMVKTLGTSNHLAYAVISHIISDLCNAE